MEASTSASFYEYRVNRDRSQIPTVILTRYFIQCTWFPKNATQSANRTSAVVACWNNQSLPFNRHKQFFIQLFFSLYIVLSIAPVYGGNHFRPKSISIETIARVQQQYLGGKLSADMKWVIINFRRKSYKKPTHTHSACQRFFQRINISIFLKHHLVKCHALRVDMMWTEGFFRYSRWQDDGSAVCLLEYQMYSPTKRRIMKSLHTSCINWTLMTLLSDTKRISLGLSVWECKWNERKLHWKQMLWMYSECWKEKGWKGFWISVNWLKTFIRMKFDVFYCSAQRIFSIVYIRMQFHFHFIVWNEGEKGNNHSHTRSSYGN